jgi:hypothetical protein
VVGLPGMVQFGVVRACNVAVPHLTVVGVALTIIVVGCPGMVHFGAGRPCTMAGIAFTMVGIALTVGSITAASTIAIIISPPLGEGAGVGEEAGRFLGLVIPTGTTLTMDMGDTLILPWLRRHPPRAS